MGPKLLLLRTTDYFAAVERMILAWALNRRAAGWRVRLIVLSRRANMAAHPFCLAAQAARLSVICLFERGLLDLRPVLTIRREIELWQPNFSHSHDYKSDLILALVGGEKHFASAHGYTDHNKRARLWRVLDRHALRRMQGIVVPSPAVAEELAVSPRRVLVVPNGLDMSAWQEAAGAPLPAVARAWAQQSGPTLLFLGRCSREKGGDFLLPVLARLRDEKVRPALLLAGAGPACADWRALARRLGLAGQVTFAGWIDQPAPLLAAADLLVMPSRREAFGMAALEAAVLGTPLLASRVGGLASLVSENRLGWLLLPDDVDAWSDALRTLLAAPAGVPRLEDAVVSAVAEQFSMEKWLSGMDAAYGAFLEAA